YWDNTNTGYRTDANLMTNGDIYWGTGANWLSVYINQVMKTTDGPSFASVTATYNGGSYFYAKTTSSSSKRGGLQFMQNSTALWELGVDYQQNNTSDFYIYDYAAGAGRLHIGAAGNVLIPQKLYVGAAYGSVPSTSLQVATDSASKPGTNTWQIS